MPEDQHTIWVLFANRTDATLLTDFLHERGYAVTTTPPAEQSPDAWEHVSLCVLDETAGATVGPGLLLARERSKAIVPVLIALDGSNDAEPWIRLGFDDVLRMPLSKAELLARLRAFLRLREYSMERQELDRARLDLVIRQIPAGVIIAEAPSGRIMLGNEQMEAIWRHGVLRSERVDEYGAWKGFHPDGRPYESHEWPLARSVLSGEVVRDEEIEIDRGEGAHGTILVSSAPVRDRDGNVVAAVATAVDITEHKELLERERLARRAAEQANRIKDEFLATVSHELRTPLNAIFGWLTMLEHGDLDDHTAEYALQTIKRNVKAQAQIIEDLLDISRIMSGKLRIEMRSVDLAAVVKEAVDSVRPAADSKRIRIRTILDARVDATLGDPDRLRQVVWNLLSNAVKFTPEGGKVEVELSSPNAHFELTVRDTGQGIEPDFLPYVFERFRQADGSISRLHGGLGVGLSIVRELVAMHGGTVEAASDGPGSGSTFTVRLPLNPVRPETETTETAASSAIASARLAGVRVLVVEDEPDSLEMLVMLLGRTGAEVRGSATAERALAILDEWRPDVIVSDISMPGTDGYELIRKVRARGSDRGGATPAVALTAFSRVEDRLRALSEGFQMHVPKPVEPDELVAVLASLLRRG